MKPSDLWKKMINSRVYSKEAVTTRVNTVYAVGQINDQEYTELINLIGEKYPENAA